MNVMNIESLREEMNRLPWFHSIDLGNGLVTPGMHKDRARNKLGILRFPEDFQGKSVLDVGAFDGFYSFEARKRGAGRILAVDKPSWVTDKPATHLDNKGSKESFDFANRILGANVESKIMMAEDISREAVGEWDVTLFLGILYHCYDPIRALENVASVTKELLIIETELDMLLHRRPALAYYPGREMKDNIGNWCGPNYAFVIEFLKLHGFKRVDVVYRYSFPKRVARAAKRALTEGGSFATILQQGRAIFHAHK